MQVSSIPVKFPIVWAASAGASYVRAIPQTTGSPIAASLALGFPPETATPVASGGTPPDVRDENGILQQITAWNQWQQVGGPVYYDSAFSLSIGGYPKGAVLSNASTPGAWWVSTADNNTSDPDTGGANWQGFDLVGLGTAAYKNASSNSLGVVASVSGAITAGHIAVFADANGSVADGGVFGPFGTAAAKAASNNSLAALASVSGGSTIGHLASFVDGNGSIQDSGLSVSGTIGAAFLATTAFVNNSYAPLASPALTGAPTAPTQSPGDNTTKLASTAFVQAAIAGFAPLVSPGFSGVPTVPTAAPGTNNTQAASTAFVQAAIGTSVRYALVNVVFSAQSFQIASFSWNSPFPTQCLGVQATALTNDTFNVGSNGNNFVSIAYGASGNTLPTASGGNLRVDTEQGGSVTGTVVVSVVGIGN